MIIVYLISVLILVNNIFGFPINRAINSSESTAVPTTKVLNFLKHYGYIENDDTNSGALYTEVGIQNTIKTVQKFGAIKQTGILDNDTLVLMSSPRCGVPDIIKKHRVKRYAFGSDGWNKRTITYFIANWSPKLGEDVVVEKIKSSLDIWGRYGRLYFQRRYTPDADIIVAFGNWYHGDRYPFDGPGNILAHAFFPYEEQNFGGDIHFDADENWSNGEKDGTDFATVALHELGHSLGLAHSVIPDSVMFPYYKGYEANKEPQLAYDDILGMYKLYIQKNIRDDTTTKTKSTESTTEFTQTSTEISSTVFYEENATNSPEETTVAFTQSITEYIQTSTKSYEEAATHSTQEFFTETNTELNTITILYKGDVESVETHKKHDTKSKIPLSNFPSLPNICQGSFDAVASLREEIFIFKDQYLWRLKQMSQIQPGYPMLIRQIFPQISNSQKIDAAYERSDGMIILFTGNVFWVHNGNQFIENSPKSITEYGLPDTLDKIDAVQKWAKNGKVYFYRRDIFWRYNEKVRKMDDGYPMHMERWRKVPYNLDAALTWKGVTYFFKDKLYWRFDNKWVIVTEESPLPSPQLWLGCSKDDL